MSDRHLSREIADVMCNQLSIDAMREQHYKDSVEIESLRTKLAKKDKRIRELELINAKQVLIRIEELEQQLAYAHRCPFCTTDADEDHIITTEQIDTAWKMATRPITEESWRCGWIAREAMMTILKHFGIVACKDCGGMNHVDLTDYDDYQTEVKIVTCDCPNNGWIRKEYDDE